MNTRAPRVDGGFALLEVLLAAGILAGGVVILLETQAASLRALRTAEEMLTAGWRLEERAWEIQRQGRGAPPDDVDSDGFHWRMEEETFSEGWTRRRLSCAWEKRGRGGRLELTLLMPRE